MGALIKTTRWESAGLVSLACLACMAAAAQDLPPPVDPNSPVRVWADQIGYRVDARKLLIVASDRPLPQPAPALELRDAASGRVVRKLAGTDPALTAFKNGNKDAESGDYVAHLDLSAIKAPGRYYVAVTSADKTQRSYQFGVGVGIYRPVAVAAWRGFYYQRADTAKPQKHAGPWNHGLAHNGPNQAGQARVYKWEGRPHWEPVGKEVQDPTPRDVRGAWWDAGNFDKYIGNTTLCHNDLLLGIQLLGESAAGPGADGLLNIPESGNGIPDILDEVRYGTEWLIRMADADGAAFGRIYEKPSCPPDKDTSPVMLTGTSSGSTMNRAAALAYAALVWSQPPLARFDPAFARRCMGESMRSWKLLETRPHPWPPDPKDPGKMAYGGEWFTADFERCRALAAACYFALTGQKAHEQTARQIMGKWTRIRPGEDGDMLQAAWVYIHAPAADADLAARLRQMVLDAGLSIVKQTGPHRGYAAGIRGYWWGSNRMIGHCGVQAIAAAELTDDPAAKRQFLDAAEEFVHYLLGRNPIGLCYVSNLKALGAERSAMVMHHGWVGDQNSPESQKYVGDGPGKIGPMPGLVVGGANGSMKRYVDELDWRKKHWEYNEPCLTYQSPCTALLGYFGLKMN